MSVCEICGNDYDKCFEIELDNKKHTFDCFECAIQGLAPTCSHCNCRIIGHGLEDSGNYYCCAHCANKEGSTHLVDRI